jgi:hypothetical protein
MAKRSYDWLDFLCILFFRGASNLDKELDGGKVRFILTCEVYSQVKVFSQVLLGGVRDGEPSEGFGDTAQWDDQESVPGDWLLGGVPEVSGGFTEARDAAAGGGGAGVHGPEG